MVDQMDLHLRMEGGERALYRCFRVDEYDETRVEHDYRILFELVRAYVIASKAFALADDQSLGAAEAHYYDTLEALVDYVDRMEAHDGNQA